MTEICGEYTTKGPCTMKKGHLTKWHRCRKYDTIEWLITSNDKVVQESGNGVNALTYAISRNRLDGRTLQIEVGYGPIQTQGLTQR